MKTKKRRNLIQLITEYAKLQLASNIPFWGTYLGFALLYGVFNLPSFYALAIPTIFANLLFFVVDDKWVFANSRGRHKSHYEIVKFIVFMTFSAVTVFMITVILEHTMNITPYIGQFIAGFAASLWTFLGLRFWVFAPAHHGPFILKRSTIKVKARQRRPKTA
jgi:putative flippase GtrA